MRGDIPFAWKRHGSILALGTLLIGLSISFSLLGAPQRESDIPPDATPEIQQIDPAQAAPGAHVTVVIHGSNFSGGAYVSSVSAAVHVDSSKRVSATQIEAQLSVNTSAQPSTVSLLVSNPASRAAESAFKIVAGATPPAPEKPPESVEPPKPATPSTPPAPATPAQPAAPTPPPSPGEANPAVPPTPGAPAGTATPAPPGGPASPTPPAAPSAPPAPATPPGPQVLTVEPPSASPGFDMDLKITGKNFAQGAKVSFANPGIRVMETNAPSSTELTVHIKVARDATPGRASLFVFNPDDSEVEVPFEVTGKSAVLPSTPLLPLPPASPSQPVSPAAPVAPGAPSAPAPPAEQRYEAFHLGSPAEVFQAHGKVKGALVVSAGTLQYQEDGKTLINIQLSDIKEIKTSSIATATFHITLASGRTYHFAPGSLHPSDARILVDSLRKSLPQ